MLDGRCKKGAANKKDLEEVIVQSHEEGWNGFGIYDHNRRLIVPRRTGARSLQPAGLSVEIGYHGRLQQEVNKLTHKAGHEFGGSDIVGS